MISCSLWDNSVLLWQHLYTSSLRKCLLGSCSMRNTHFTIYEFIYNLQNFHSIAHISIPYYNLDEWFLLSGKRHALFLSYFSRNGKVMISRMKLNTPKAILTILKCSISLNKYLPLIKHQYCVLIEFHFKLSMLNTPVCIPVTIHCTFWWNLCFPAKL